MKMLKSAAFVVLAAVLHMETNCLASAVDSSSASVADSVVSNTTSVDLPASITTTSITTSTNTTSTTTALATVLSDALADDNGNASRAANDTQMDRNIFIMPLWQQIIWSVLFSTIIILAAGGNIIVIWTVMTDKRMKSVTNCFLVNLSLADIMVSTLNVTFNFIYMLNSYWPFGEFYCKVSNFIGIFSVAASVFTLMAISIDRYLAIMHPLRQRLRVHYGMTTIYIIVGIWIASTILSLPNILFSITTIEKYKNGDYRLICYLKWPDGDTNVSEIEYWYNIVILLTTYVVPIVSLGFAYFRIGIELWGSQSIGESTDRQLDNIRNKRKIVKMMIVVVVIFGICWAPYHAYFLIAHHYPEINKSHLGQIIYLCIYWVAMSNSVYNPFVYCWLNSRFRQGFKRFLCFRCCFKDTSDSTNITPRNYHGTRYSCASEACISDMRVRFNGNGNITLHATVSATEMTTINTNGPGTTTSSSSPSPLQPKMAFSREML